MSDEDDDSGGADDSSVHITIETPGGRTTLRGEDLDGSQTPGAGDASPSEPEGSIPAPDVEAVPPGDMDADTLAIDTEMAQLLQPGEGEVRYPGWRVGLPRKLGAYVALIRPFTLLAPLFGGLSACLLALSVQDFEGFNWATLSYGVATLVLLNAASNCLNGAYDAHIDRINKPYRPIPQGLVTRDEALSLAWVLYFLAFVRALLINVQFAALVIIITVITLYYSMPPVRLKKRLWLSNIAIAFGRGLLGFTAAWAIFGDVNDPTPWVIGGILFIYLTGATTSKDFTDMEGDLAYGIRTLPVVYGPRRSAIIAGPFFIIPFVLIPVGVFRGYLPEAANGLTVLLAWGAYVMWLLQTHATERDPNFENSPVWKHMYLMLFALQLGFAAVYMYDYWVT